jgi:hypothetical protein
MLACLAFAGLSTYAMFRPLLSSLIRNGISLPAVFGAGLLLFAMLIPAALAWLAWRFWRRWNPATVRWLVGICMALLILRLDMLPTEWTKNASLQRTDMISSLLAIPLLVFGAIGYRYLAQSLIRFADLKDALDIYGQPVGHQMRIRNFAGLLGFSIFLAGGAVDQAFDYTKNPTSWQASACIFGPIVLGYCTYKIIVWYSKPRTQPSLPAGGFEVITNAAPVAQRTELA